MDRIIKYTVLSSVATVLLWAIAVIGYGMFSASSLTAIGSRLGGGVWLSSDMWICSHCSHISKDGTCYNCVKNHAGPTTIDSRGEPNSAEILRARDANGFWLGNVYLSHDFEVVSDEDYSRFKHLSHTSQLEAEIQELEELKRLVDFYDPNRIKSFTFYDANGVGHEFVLHESTVLYDEDILKEIK